MKKNWDQEKVEMLRRHEGFPHYRMPGEPSSFDILYGVIKAGDPTLKGSEEIRQTYRKPR